MLFAAQTVAAANAAELSGNDARLLSIDLHADAAAVPIDGVLVLLFSLPDCHWCHAVRSGYLLPLLREPAANADLRIRELPLSGEPVIDLDGEHRDIDTIAARWSVKAAPTVLFLDRCGGELAEPLVGGDVAGFYAAYFDRALAAARTRAAARDSTIY
ncbi:hypothetical protein [Nevskia sp.]|uniref:hypothetical protein n=1 Tax=Nevskia sp. TaxID=1929292 RepID=UPI0025CFEF5E|nr:hypothetical protein [Nevskia sp.]